ncbi:hypothetical protein E2493_14015 [Sphingomonas parva]|uniref:DUF2511 domain-containing protein n=1 Tax=Sphingomonas parva TaxID=2555898 RepID=A0A4Y8ZT48_9SPHN|nr:hypothetical protein [Sphingomonas parva]TFI57636.1 hypothetical protein E2493_14015 [Sphingomonas parva]
MKNWFIVLAVACAASPAVAQDFPGAMIADFYMENFSTPKGWTLSYKGNERGTQVFVMDRDLDAFPQPGFLQPIEQLRRVMCGDEALKAMIAAGTIVRVDARDKQDGKTSVTKGPQLTRC